MNEQELIMTTVLQCGRTQLYADCHEITDEQKQIIENILARRRSGEPLQYLLGEGEFLGLKLKMAPGVFIPRPETELLVEKILEELKDRKGQPLSILEFGTGSGNIAISLAVALPQANICSVDVSEEAFVLAQENAVRHGVDEQIVFENMDMKDVLAKGLGGRPPFDVIVSNPPYVAREAFSFLPEDVRKEPMAALDGGKDGCDFYRAIIARAASLLVEGGFLAMEIGEEQRIILESIIRKTSGWGSFCFERDLNNRDRILFVKKYLSQ